MRSRLLWGFPPSLCRWCGISVQTTQQVAGYPPQVRLCHVCRDRLERGDRLVQLGVQRIAEEESR